MVRLGSYGVWSLFWRATPARSRRIEELGYGALWLGGSPADLSPVRTVLESTSRIVVGTSVVNIFQTDPAVIGAEFVKLSTEFPDRVVLGLGIGHQQRLPGREVTPLDRMSEYLDILDQTGVSPEHRFLAALGPRMLRLASQRTAGTVPYLAPPANTANARATLDPDSLVVAEHKVVLETDLSLAFERARATIAPYFATPNYTANLRRYGYTDADFTDRGSDRLVDAVVAMGSAQTILHRLDDHFRAGADHLAIQVIEPSTDKWTRELDDYFSTGHAPAVTDEAPDDLLDTLTEISVAISEHTVAQSLSSRANDGP